jgi:hypothetical protein
MTDDLKQRPRNVILRRICVIQIGIFVTATLTLFSLQSNDFGFFWHTFMLGGLGASIALQRKITKKSEEELEYLAGDRIAIAMPVLYGCVMAAVTYGLFMSNLVAGDSSGGLLSSNVFPVFVLLDPVPEDRNPKVETPDAETPGEETPGEETPDEETPDEEEAPNKKKGESASDSKPASGAETEADAETDPESPVAEKETPEETKPASPASKDVMANAASAEVPKSSARAGSSLRNESGKGVTWKEFFRMRPATTEDLGKLFVWCFLAGYSESFVTGLLSRLEQTGSRPAGGSPAGSGNAPAAQPATRRKRSS